MTIEAILNDTTQNENNVNLTITYNNNSTLNITLAGQLDVTMSNTDKLITKPMNEIITNDQTNEWSSNMTAPTITATIEITVFKISILNPGIN